MQTQTTISLKVPKKLASKLKKTSKLRGVSMSQFIRSRLENIFDTESDQKNTEQPEIFKYLCKFDDDDDLRQFDLDLEKRKANYQLRKVDF